MGQNFRFPIDFAGHRYNSAAAIAQPVLLLGFVCTEQHTGICPY